VSLALFALARFAAGLAGPESGLAAARVLAAGAGAAWAVPAAVFFPAGADVAEDVVLVEEADLAAV